MEVLRLLWAGGPASHHGRFFRFAEGRRSRPRRRRRRGPSHRHLPGRGCRHARGRDAGGGRSAATPDRSGPGGVRGADGQPCDLGGAELALLGCGVTTSLGAALNTAAVAPGPSVAVIGGGGVGQPVVQGVRIAGAAVIIAIDPVPGRRAASVRRSYPRRGPGPRGSGRPGAGADRRPRRRLQLRGRRADRTHGPGLRPGSCRGDGDARSCATSPTSSAAPRAPVHQRNANP